MDEARYLTRLVTIIERVINYLYVLDIAVFQVNDSKKRAAPKMVCHNAF
jgi:hypothetical protein